MGIVTGEGKHLVDEEDLEDFYMSEKILEEIKENGFDNFVVTDEGEQEDENESR